MEFEREPMQMMCLYFPRFAATQLQPFPSRIDTGHERSGKLSGSEIGSTRNQGSKGGAMFKHNE